MAKKTVQHGVYWVYTAVLLAVFVYTPYSSAVPAAGYAVQRPVCNAGPNNNRAALTFDTSWGADKTREILEILDMYDAHATFFVTGFWAQANPALVREIVRCGHEIGNHSTAHKNMAAMPQEEIIAEIEQTSTLLGSIAGVHPRLFRPPFGAYNSGVVSTARALGYHTVLWDVDSEDYACTTVQQVMQRIEGHVRDGSIVLFQNNGQATPGALVQTLMLFEQMGLRTATVSELIGESDYVVDVHGTLVRME